MNSNINKKQLLKNPLEFYTSSVQQYTDENKNNLIYLHQEYCVFLEKIKQLTLHNQKASRKIGETKKNNQPINILLDGMKKNSCEIKSLKKQLKDIEVKIFNFFNLNEMHSQDNNKTSIQSNVRQYKLKDIDIHSISVLTLSNKTQDWDDYVNENSASSIYHLSVWKDLIFNTFGHNSLYLYALDNQSKIIGVLPLIHLKSLLFGNFMVSAPYFNYGGAIADHPDIEKILLKKASEYAKKSNVSHIEYRDDILREGLPVKTEKINMILPLPTDQDIFWTT